MKIKIFAFQKKLLRKWKDKPQTGKIFSNQIFDKEHI